MTVCLHVCICTMCAVPENVRRRHWAPGKVIDGCKLPCAC